MRPIKENDYVDMEQPASAVGDISTAMDPTSVDEIMRGAVMQYIQQGILVRIAQNTYQIRIRDFADEPDCSEMSLADLLKYERTLRWESLCIESTDVFEVFGGVTGICQYLSKHPDIKAKCRTEQTKYEAFLKHQNTVRKLLNLIP